MILITGNSGYIGSHLTQLLNGSLYIFGLDKNKPMIPVSYFINQNLLDKFKINIIFDCVIHLAAEVSVNESVKNPALYYQTNIYGTLNLLKSIKTKSFILASTGSAEYMNNPYAISKRAAEDITIEYCTGNNVPYTVFRFYNVFGATCREPTNKDGLLWNLMKAKETGVFNLYGDDYKTEDGSAIRDYVHVEEICYSIKKAINNPSNSVENLGHGKGLSVKQMIEFYKKTNNCDFEVIIKPKREGDLERSVLSNPSKYMTYLYNFNIG